MNSTSPFIEDIADTAFFVAAQRAMETKRHDAYFQDPLSEVLAGTKGIEMMRSMGQNYPRVAIVVRTCLIDRLIEQIIVQENIDTIINLGAGFDTRPYRLSLPNSLHWIEVDLPELISYKKHQLNGKKSKCSLESIGLDLSDISARNAFLGQISNKANRALVLTEGFVGYLIPAEVKALSADLNSQTYVHFWLLEIMSPLGLATAQAAYDRYFAHSNVSINFAPEEGINFFLKRGWKRSDSYSYWDEAESFGLNNISEAKLPNLNSNDAELLRNAVRLVLLQK